MTPLSPASEGTPVDVRNCDREPIHIPGRIQPHGVLFAIDESTLSVVQTSANVNSFLGVPLDAVLGAPISQHFDPAEAQAVLAWLRSPDVREQSPRQVTVAGKTFQATAHRHDSVLILEIENPRSETDPSTDYQAVRRAVGRLQSATTLQDFCRVAANEIRDLTGFDRVHVYQFDDDWNGHVIAEAKREDLTPLLHLHFPASDIPEQARRLYHLNKIRLIADVASTPAPLTPERNPLTSGPLDLSFSVLRSVSPVHIQYLKNMGAQTSMSVSLMREGRLWGLLSCMHYSAPRYVPPDVRDACEFLGQLVSAQLAVKEDAEGFEYRGQLQAVRERLLQRMSAEPNLVRALPGDDLLTLTGATGAAVVYAGTCALTGLTPTEDQVKRLVSWLRVHTEGDVFHTDSLGKFYPEAIEFKDQAAGVVAVATTKAQGHYVLWFRPEVIQTVAWGGDPSKAVEGRSPSGLLSPRRSFELWQEVVRLKSLPWRQWEIDAARALRDAVIAVVVRRAEELTRLNAELERSNSDLDAFAFITSHDLKEPLRGIHNYANFVIEDYSDKLDEEGKQKLQTLARLAQRLEDIVESLLHYSRLGRADLSLEPVNLNEVVRNVLDVLKMSLDAARVEVRIPRPLPVVRCDRVQAELVYSNLITNAMKYSDKSQKWVEIGYSEPVQGGAGAPTLYVRDNGIGIAEKHRSAVFRMFKRLHGRDKFGGGTGAGLAFAKKIVDRHGGSLWIESALNEGSTFYFTLGS